MKSSYKPSDDKVELLIKYAQGDTSEEESVRIRKALKKDEQLRNDLYFLINSFYDVYEEEVRPSISFLTNYYFDRDKIPAEIAKSLENHIEACKDCTSEIEEIKNFDAETENIVEKHLDRISSNEPETVMDILRKLSEQYLDSELGANLLDEIENIDFGESKQVPQMGLALTGDTSKELVGKEKDFLEIVKGLLSEKDEMDALIREGDSKKIESKLLEVLEDEELVGVIMDLYRE